MIVRLWGSGARLQSTEKRLYFAGFGILLAGVATAFLGAWLEWRSLSYLGIGLFLTGWVGALQAGLRVRRRLYPTRLSPRKQVLRVAIYGVMIGGLLLTGAGPVWLRLSGYAVIIGSFVALMALWRVKRESRGRRVPIPGWTGWTRRP